MNEKYQKLYENLLQDTGRLWRTGRPEDERAEACFERCLDYWAEVKRVVAEEDFRSDRDEIRFFKYIKPRFTGQLEYYTQIYHYLLFCPKADPGEIAMFNRNELMKIERFREVHGEFVSYLIGKDTSLDAELFLRRNFNGENAQYARIFDVDKGFSTTQGWLLTQLAGYGLYGDYVRGKMRYSLY